MFPTHSNRTNIPKEKIQIIKSNWKIMVIKILKMLIKYHLQILIFKMKNLKTTIITKLMK